MTGTPLWEIGGPHLFASTQSVFTVPLSTLIHYDYDVLARNSDGASSITGGLNGEPSRINFYIRGPYEQTAIYFASTNVYAPVYSGTPAEQTWTKSSSNRVIVWNTYTITATYGVDWRRRDPDRRAPSDFQIAIPPARSIAFIGGRLFAGNVYNVVTSERRRGDAYYSAKGNPFRMQSVFTDEINGSRNEYAGEEIQRILEMGAGSQSAVYIMLWTDKETKVLGGSGPLGGASASTSDLANSFTISERGTRAWRSVATSQGRAFWLDQYGQIQRLQDGQVENISMLSVDDKPKAIPAAYRATTFGIITRDRYNLSYTPEGETTNTRMLGFNIVIGKWEFDDLFPGSVSGERMVEFYDSTQAGPGQRWILGSANGLFYEYDIEDADDLDADIAVRITTREFAAKGDESIRIGGVWMSVTPQEALWTFRRHYRRQDGVTRSQAKSAAGRFWDGGKTEVESGFEDGLGERGKAAYLDIQGSVIPGTVAEHLGIELLRESGDDAEEG